MSADCSIKSSSSGNTQGLNDTDTSSSSQDAKNSKLQKAVRLRGNFTKNAFELSQKPVSLNQFSLKLADFEEMLKEGKEKIGETLAHASSKFCYCSDKILRVFTSRVIGTGNFKTVYDTVCYDPESHKVWLDAQVVVRKSIENAEQEQKLQEDLLSSTTRVISTGKNVIKKTGCLSYTMEKYATDFKHAVADGASPLTIFTAFRDVTQCLLEAHKKGIFHRDLKLANVFLEVVCTEELIRAKVGDWGLAWPNGSNAPRKQGRGNPLHLAPEVAVAVREGKNGGVLQCTEKAEVWAVGVMLYHALWTKNEKIYPNWLRDMVGWLRFSHYSYSAPNQEKVSKTIEDLDQSTDLLKSAAKLLAGALQLNPEERVSMLELKKGFEQLVAMARSSLEKQTVEKDQVVKRQTSGELIVTSEKQAQQFSDSISSSSSDDDDDLEY